MMSPTIRIDDEVFAALQKEAQAFIDTPNAVLRRVLKLDSAGRGEAQSLTRRESRRRAQSIGRAPRAASADLLPASEYEGAILAALAVRDGSASSAEVVEAVGTALDQRLTKTDRETLATGEVRWRNRVHWVRYRLAEKGLLNTRAPRGIWALTEAGKAAARPQAHSSAPFRQDQRG